MKEAPGSSETSVLTRATRRNNPEDTILHSHRREDLKSYIKETYIPYNNTALYGAINTDLHLESFVEQTPWPLGRKRTIPTVRPPLVDEI
jgi:hypothetical protein